MEKSEYRVNLVNEYLTKLSLSEDIKEFFFRRNILVTGGAGAIGSNLVIALSELVGDQGMVIVLDNLSAIKGSDPIDFPSLSNVMFVKGDVRNDVDLKRVFRERPTIVYHLAAFFANQNSVDYPENSADVDINGIIKLLDLAQFTNVERFVYASSGCAIYGSYGEMPLKEDFISMHLTTPYQINKTTGEMYSNFYHHHYGLPSQSIAINIGSENGIMVNMAVMDENGLLGKTIYVEDNSTLVQLVTDNNFRVSVRIGQDRELGLFLPTHGKYGILEGVRKSMPLQQGEIAYTSGISTIYPPNIPVARVISAIKNDNHPFQHVVVELLGYIDTLDYVFVIL